MRKKIGGQVDNDAYQHTCAIRMSYTLNYSGDPIPRRQPGLYTVRGADKKAYALRMRELAEYLKKHWGKPSLEVKRPINSCSWS